jgi:hypothetical protein
VDQVLAIPLYKNYSTDGTSQLTIAHPFVYKQGADLEESLAAFGGRDRLHQVVFWIPGYFPVCNPRSFWDLGLVDGKRTVVQDVQSCMGEEEGQLNAAMETLLEKESFIVRELKMRKSPGHTEKATRTEEPYDFHKLVEANSYQIRFFKYGSASEHGLWCVRSGTPIINRFSADEKNIVAAFATDAAKMRGVG